jgi:hypothetical protein
MLPQTLRNSDNAGRFWAHFNDNERIGEIGPRRGQVRSAETTGCE